MPYINNLSNWQVWSPWEKLDPSIEFTVAKPSAGVGAHLFWQSKWGMGEMTITSISRSSTKFNILFNNEHIVTGALTFTQEQNKTLVSCELNGEVTTPIIGGYLALFSQYILNNTVALGLNNLRTTLQLHIKNSEN
ncbi:SRPBCC family protein [Pseudoalteromonas sp. H105]|uniref:SRPBCC family protein n=1 Tax=Pseudoalteromonas sp. H105 TaxID=1348393 RepID=UPI001F365B23|nr:SRPBCC family protein [Pseudoalteromonas sp. H105]